LEKVGVVSEFVEGVLYPRKLGGTRAVFVTRANGRFYALSNICTPHGFTITPGTTDGATVLCPVHDALFDLGTGACISGPAGDPLPVYAVTVEGDDVMVGEAFVSE
jgi:3-phenylpropionate/trans-cinnamate dioxygenase ferredoxin subunit